LHLGSLDAGHVGLDLEANRSLQVGEVAVALGKAGKQRRIKRATNRGGDMVHAVLLIDLVPKAPGPEPAALRDEVVEPATAVDVPENIVHAGALRDRHLGLRYGAIAG